MPTIEDAIVLATESHRGQTDKAGLPFILHPLRVMASFLASGDGDARMVAVLHDVIEDSDVTCAMLLETGLSSRRGRRAGGHQQEGRGALRQLHRAGCCESVGGAGEAGRSERQRPSTKVLSPDTPRRYEFARRYLWELPGRLATEEALRSL